LDEADWNYMYGIVLNAGIAIETVEKQQPSIANSAKALNIKGEALFFRALGLYNVVQYYTSPYDSVNALTTPGVPLRLTSDASIKSKRATLQQSWDQITSDLTLATHLLAPNNSIVSRPWKISAYAALAGVYLDMGKYKQALFYADSTLFLNDTLIDNNSVDPKKLNPYSRFKSEVLFSSVSQYPGMLSPTNYKVDSLLYNSYDSNDLRRKLFFTSNGPKTVGFRGSYDGSNAPFNGYAIDEIYLIKAECEAREGLIESAMATLNKLLITRWKTNTFKPLTSTSIDDALDKILTERRKELVQRSRRWFDLRRLNKDSRFAKTLRRIENGTTYTLPPGDSRYVFLIPAQVIELTGIEQNSR
jgi:tetratricopeptide (TPR) repeat protein